MVQRCSTREVTIETRDAGEVHEVGRGNVIATLAAIHCQCRLELASRLREIARAFSDETKIIVVGGHAARVADARPECDRLRVFGARRAYVAAVLPHRGQSADRVRRDGYVADRFRQCPGALQVPLSAIELLGARKGRSDIAEDRSNCSRVANSACARQGTSPHDDGSHRAVPAVHGDSSAPCAVHPDLTCLPLRRGRGKAGYLAR